MFNLFKKNKKSFKEDNFFKLVSVFSYNGKKIAEYKNCFIEETRKGIILKVDNREINFNNEIIIKE